jgi:hypothetical protein
VLGLAGRPDEVAHADLAVWRGGQDRKDPQPHGVGQRAETLGHVGRLFGAGGAASTDGQHSAPGASTTALRSTTIRISY